MPTPPAISRPRTVLLPLLLPAALGLLSSWVWVRQHPPAIAPEPAPPAAEEIARPEPDRLPPDADGKRVLAAAIGGNIAAAKDYLLLRLSTAPGEDQSGLLAAVVAQDPAWLEGYLDRYLASQPTGYPDDQWSDSVSDRLDHLIAALWRSEPEALWKAAELSPRLRANLPDLLNWAAATLTRENALRVLDPAFGIDDNTIRFLCASVPDAEVQSRILEMVRQGHFNGRLLQESIATLLKMQVEQPELFQSLELQMTPEMKDALADARNPAKERDPSPDRINDILEKTGQFVPLANVVALLPESSAADAAFEMCRADYFFRHLPQIDREMHQLIAAAPADREKLEEFAESFFRGCEIHHRDPAQWMEWREALSEDSRGDLFNYYAKSDPAGALNYAREKMPPGPERDALIEAATAQLP